MEAKNQIAAIASRLIEDGDHLMLDDSSTSLYLAKKLKEKKNLTVDDLLHQFTVASGKEFANDRALLG